ncbi:MAG: aminotransferase class I/II-fold pyridoxal phosphate-dependent enzyme [bacterium]|nr:aminotransferase class I/II-fold pyridoxal phosphate-dependent enzyme [bacterium]
MPGTELFGAEERKEIEDVLSTGIMFRYNHDALRNNFWKAKDFEAEAKKITQAKYALAVSNGSAAILAALAASGIGAGDEVICPPFTYIATIEAILFLGGLPVFAEIDETLCLSAEGIKKAIGPKTKAVCLVHMCGGNANMDEIMAVVKQHNLILVEDAGQAFASSYKGTYTGLFGKAGAYSFDFFKIATAGEGGIMVTNDEPTYKLADSFCDHGHDHVGDKRGMENHPIIGFNFRISELHAAVGAAQTRKVPTIREINRHHKSFLQSKLAKTEGISFAKLGDENGDSATFLNMLLPSTEIAQRVVDEFNKAGIAGFDYWFKNMYHFINQWDHIKNMKTASKLAVQVLGAPQDYNNLQLPKTQEVIGRLISFGIKCNWTDAYMTEMAEKMSACVQKAMSPVNA